MFEIVVLIAVGILYLLDFIAVRRLVNTLDRMEERLDAVERGEFKDYGRGDDEFGLRRLAAA